MGKDKGAASASIWHELFLEAGLYKRSQGRIARQVTFAALAITIGLGVWQLFDLLSINDSAWIKYGIPGAILVVGVWLSYRVVNLPRFADFLISVEAEMNKVSWPSRGELIRSSVVVVFVIFFLAMLLFGYDLFWQTVFTWIGILHGAEGG